MNSEIDEVSEITEHQDRLAIEAFALRGRLATTAMQPEFVRAQMMPVHLQTILDIPCMTLNDCFEAVYGPQGARAFWKIECSELRSWTSFLDLLALVGGIEGQSYQTLHMGLANSMLEARQMKADLFAGDTAALDRARWGWQVKSDALKVNVGSAAAWLLSRPRHRHLVPESLRAFLELDGQADAPIATLPARANEGHLPIPTADAVSLPKPLNRSDIRPMPISLDALRSFMNRPEVASLATRPLQWEAAKKEFGAARVPSRLVGRFNRENPRSAGRKPKS